MQPERQEQIEPLAAQAVYLSHCGVSRETLRALQMCSAYMSAISAGARDKNDGGCASACKHSLHCAA